MTAIYQRELRSYFHGMTGYVFIAFLLVFRCLQCRNQVSHCVEIDGLGTVVPHPHLSSVCVEGCVVWGEMERRK